jgi:iron complex outermembrane receptor protein
VGNLFPLDMALVERIEYIPGPGGAVYGQNAMFGVVNVVTRSGAGVGGVEIAAAAQSPQELVEGRLTWGRRLDNGVEVLLSASALEARGEDRVYDFGSAGVSGLAAGMDGERDREIFARIGRGAWSFDLVYGDRRKDDPTGAYFSDPLVPGQNQSDRYALAHFQYQESFRGDTLQLLGRLFWGQEDYDSRLSYGTSFAFPATGRWHGGELRLLSTAMADHKWMLGLELQNNTVIRQAIRDVATPANDIVISGSGSRAGLYAQDEWRFAEGWIATLGVRVDHDDTTGTKTSPRAALIWQAAPATTLKAMYGRAHRAPNAYESDYDDGFAQVANPALPGESITTLELVADQRVGTDLALRAAAYQWTMQGLITLGIDPVSGVTQYQSGDTVKARGLELSADKTWTAGARLRGSLALQDVAYAGGGGPLNSPEVLAKLNLSAPLPWAGLHAGYEIRYDSRRLSVDGTRLGGYAVSNLHLRTEALAPGLGLALSLANVFEKRHAHPGADSNWQNAIDQDGRTVRVQLDYRF